MNKSLWRRLSACCTLLGFLWTASAWAQKDEKLTLEAVVAKHVQALGHPDKVKAATTRRLEGTAEFKIIMGGAGNLTGPAAFVSDRQKLSFFVNFDDPMYHGERLNYDGARLDVGTLRPGARTPVGDFLFNHLEIVGEGLFGGVLSAAWPLGDLPAHQPKLKYEGIKMVKGQKVHVLRYQGKKQSGDLEIKLFFEEGTFRHLGTQYRTSAGTVIAGTPGEAARQENLEYILEEEFSEFGDAAGVMLPGKWKITYSRRTPQKGSSIWQWELYLGDTAMKKK